MDENLLNNKNILVVDDEVDLREIVASEFDFMGSRVYQAENIQVAQKILSEHKIDLVVSDIRMPGGTGIDLLDQIKSKDVRNPPIMLITGFADISVENAFAKGAEALINKPFKLDDLIQTAVKCTTPAGERYREKDPPTQTIEFRTDLTLKESSVEYFRIGRGGFAVALEPRGYKFELGEVVHFKFTFKDQALSGDALVRWYKHQDVDPKYYLGLEAKTLEGPTLSFFLKYWSENPTVAFIPALGSC